ncbi:MAG: HEPN domain-containing protein [Spirochaetes bacterium]|nr:HEPN domain-containing protein [Spirochaetota bacterium]
MRNESLEEGKRWYRQSREDLKWSRVLMENNGGYHIICFLCQQIGEKGLKAYLYAKGEELVLGHSILKLLEKAAGYDPTFTEKISAWAILDNYYITARYPNGIPDGIPAAVFNRDMAAQALTIAAEILDTVNGIIGFD